jgi:hypothetical protein
MTRCSDRVITAHVAGPMRSQVAPSLASRNRTVSVGGGCRRPPVAELADQPEVDVEDGTSEGDEEVLPPRLAATDGLAVEESCARFEATLWRRGRHRRRSERVMERPRQAVHGVALGHGGGVCPRARIHRKRGRPELPWKVRSREDAT